MHTAELDITAIYTTDDEDIILACQDVVMSEGERLTLSLIRFKDGASNSTISFQGIARAESVSFSEWISTFVEVGRQHGYGFQETALKHFLAQVQNLSALETPDLSTDAIGHGLQVTFGYTVDEGQEPVENDSLKITFEFTELYRLFQDVSAEDADTMGVEPGRQATTIATESMLILSLYALNPDHHNEYKEMVSQEQ